MNKRGENATISPQLKALLESSEIPTATQQQRPNPAPVTPMQEVRHSLD